MRDRRPPTADRRARVSGDDAPVDDYTLVDAGDGARLERCGPYLIDRPAPGAVEARRDPTAWADANLRFDRDGGWTGSALPAAVNGWSVRLAGVTVGLRPTAAGQLGCFPEHATLLPWLHDRVRSRSTHDRRPEVLNLFASTGLVTLAAAAAGAAVVHVDASRPAVAWARDNARLNDLEGAPIRWLVEDAATFAAREARRGRLYDGIVLDPPSYGHGAGRTWRIERDLPALLATLRSILVDDGFVLLTAHTTGLEGEELAALLEGFPGQTTAGPLTLTAASGARLRLGTWARNRGA
jgi:23S rRNA (cytosine1962-C5)-methyltransferase